MLTGVVGDLGHLRQKKKTSQIVNSVSQTLVQGNYLFPYDVPELRYLCITKDAIPPAKILFSSISLALLRIH